MQELDRMYNINEDEAIIYQTSDKFYLAIINGKSKRIFDTYDQAINKLYKMGYRF